ncbi:hypothetical protein T11_14750 [Trichinella zimbabwensis]|uniref:Uncharacterized protein n=1 Tax=Trichinella zimbabwensis TaxID=268475 RepID=A0A0V1I107_9BILA|nr:hypothetical protein T11_14750 [Trichinella zimbabwensis]
MKEISYFKGIFINRPEYCSGQQYFSYLMSMHAYVAFLEGFKPTLQEEGICNVEKWIIWFVKIICPDEAIVIKRTALNGVIQQNNPSSGQWLGGQAPGLIALSRPPDTFVHFGFYNLEV